MAKKWKIAVLIMGLSTSMILCTCNKEGKQESSVYTHDGLGISVYIPKS